MPILSFGVFFEVLDCSCFRIFSSMSSLLDREELLLLLLGEEEERFLLELCFLFISKVLVLFLPCWSTSRAFFCFSVVGGSASFSCDAEKYCCRGFFTTTSFFFCWPSSRSPLKISTTLFENFIDRLSFFFFNELITKDFKQQESVTLSVTSLVCLESKVVPMVHLSVLEWRVKPSTIISATILE